MRLRRTYKAFGSALAALAMSAALTLGIAPAFAAQGTLDYDPAAQQGTSTNHSGESQINSLSELSSQLNYDGNAQQGGIDNAGDAQATDAVVLKADGNGSYFADAPAHVVVVDGLLFEVDDDAMTASFIGWQGASPVGKIAIPAAITADGASYDVTSISAAYMYNAGNQDLAAFASAVIGAQDGKLSDAALRAFFMDVVGSGLTAPGVFSISIPSTVTSIDPAAFALYPALATFEVAPANDEFVSLDRGRMLVEEPTGTLLLMAPASTGSAVIPLGIRAIEPNAFSLSLGLTSFGVQPQIGPDAPAFEASYGILYSIDGATLLAAPASIGANIIIDERCMAIAEGAFSHVPSIDTITTFGDVATIANGSYASAHSVTEAAAPSIIDSIAAFFTGGNAEMTLAAFGPDSIQDTLVIFSSEEDMESSASAWRACGFDRFEVAPAIAEAVDSDDVDDPEGTGAATDASSNATVNGDVALSDPDQVVPVDPAAGTVATEPGFAYTLLDDYTLSVSWNGPFPEGALEIPATAELNGRTYKVSKVADGAFAGAIRITSVSVPDTIKSIGNSAFEGAFGIRHANIGSSVRTIGERAFAGTTLIQLELPASVEAIGAYAFDGLDGLMIVAHGNVASAQGALGSTSDAKLYAPLSDDGAYGWDLGLPASGNRFFPYAIAFGGESYRVDASTGAALFDHGILSAEGSRVEYAYDDSILAVDQATGIVSANPDLHESAEAHLTATLVADLPEPQLVDGVVHASVVLGTTEASVKTVYDGPADVPESIDSLSDDGAEILPAAAGLARISVDTPIAPIEESEVSQMAGTTTLKTGKEVNAALKKGIAYNKANANITQVYFGRLDAYTIPDAAAETKIDTGGLGAASGGASVYVYTYSTTDIRVYVVSNNTMVLNSDSSYLFYGMTKLSTLVLDNIDSSNVTNLSYAFGTVSQTAGLTNFDTAVSQLVSSRVTDMSYMFTNCKRLYSLSLHLPTMNTTAANLNYMFTTCTAMTSVTLYNLKASTVASMFTGCSVLRSITISDMTVATATSMFTGVTGYVNYLTLTNFTATTAGSLLNGCSVLTSATLTNVRIDNPTTFFNGCKALKTLTIDGFVQTAENTATSMFNGCTVLNSLSITGMDLSKSTTMLTAFSGCAALTSFDMNSLGLKASYPNFQQMFLNCTSLTSVTNLGGFNVTTTALQMFKGCTALRSIDLSNFTTAISKEMFNGCSALTTLEWENFKVDSDATSMFYSCTRLNDVDFSKPNWSTAPTCTTMFYGCSSLNKLNLNGLKASNCTNMFQNCTGLTSIDAANISSPNFSNMFNGCTYLVNVNIVGITSTTATTSFYYMFNGCSRLERVTIEGLNKNVTVNMATVFTSCTKLAYATFKNLSMNRSTSSGDVATFNGCTALNTVTYENVIAGTGQTGYFSTGTTKYVKHVDIKDWTSSTDTTNMFKTFTNLETIVLDNFTDNGGYDGFFNGCTRLNSVKFVNPPKPASNTTSMQSMFEGCTSLTTDSYDFGGMNVSGITNMKYMFKGCTNITSWDANIAPIPNANTALDYMFQSCTYLKEVDLTGLKGTTVTYMFDGCTRLTDVDLTNVSLTNGTSMFNGCTNLANITFKNTQIATMSNMFLNCTKITQLDLDDVVATATMTSAFKGCTGLNTLKLTKVSSPNMTNLFEGCSYLKSVDLVEVDCATSMASMFLNCSRLVDVNFGSVTATNMTTMFSGCTSLTEAVIPAIKPTTATTTIVLTQMYYGCYNIKNAQIHIDTVNTKVTTNNMFINCTNLETVSLKGFTTVNGSGEAAAATFSGCRKITYLDVEDVINSSYPVMLFSTYSTTVVRGMIPEIYVKNYTSTVGANLTLFTGLKKFTMENGHISSFNSFFKGCTNLEEVVFKNMPTLTATDMSLMFSEVESSVLKVDFGNMDASTVTSMASMFANCSKVTKFDISPLKATGLTNASSMFLNCTSITEAWVPQLSSPNLANVASMFQGCTALKTVNLSNLNTKNVTNATSMFQGCTGFTGTFNADFFKPEKTCTMTTMFSGMTRVIEIDLSALSYTTMKTFTSMFNGDTNLMTIVVNEDWAYAGTSTSGTVFDGCTKLLGQRGTSLVTTSNNGGATYMKIDEIGQPGFLSIPYTSLETGLELNAHLKEVVSDDASAVVNTSVQDVNFGTTEKYLEEITGLTGIAVDRYHEGSIMMYRSRNGKHIYIICDEPSYRMNYESQYMFANMAGLTSINFGDISTRTVTDMSHMFYGLAAMETLDIYKFATPNVTDMTYAFAHNPKMTTIIGSAAFDTSKVAYATGIFQSTLALVGDKGTAIQNTSSYTNTRTYARIDGGKSSPGLFSEKTYKLVPGKTFNSIIKNQNKPANYLAASGGPRNIYFGYTSQYNNILSQACTVSYIDVEGEGNILLMHPKASAEKYNYYILSDYRIQANEDMSYMFYGLTVLTSLTLNNLDTSKTTDMSFLFAYYYAMDSFKAPLDLRAFDTSSVINMSYMFSNTWQVPSYNLTSFDTSKVEDMSYMFHSAGAAQVLDLTSFRGDSVKTMESMFGGRNRNKHYSSYYSYYRYSRITSVKFKDFGGANNTTLKDMFLYCTSMETLDLSSFDASSVTTTVNMFLNCTKLTTINFRDFNTSSVVDMSYMFKNCQALTSIALPMFDVSNVTKMTQMFYQCYALKTADLLSFVTPKLIDTSNMFYKCSALTTIYATKHFDVSTAPKTGGMFSGCNVLVGGFGTAVSVFKKYDKTYACLDTATENGYYTSATYKLVAGKTLNARIKNKASYTEVDTTVKEIIFGYIDEYREETKHLTPVAVDLENYRNILLYRSVDGDTVYILSHAYINTGVDASYMFYNLQALESIVFDNFKTKGATNMQAMFSNCMTIGSVDMGSFDSSSTTNIQNMFSGCTEINTIYVSEEWDTHNVNPDNGTNVFEGCSLKLVGGNGTRWDNINLDYNYAQLDTVEHPGYFTAISYVLLPGSQMSRWIKNASAGTNNKAVKYIIFGNQEVYAPAVAGLSWVPVDLERKGNIKLYRSADKSTVWILSECTISANSDSSYMFRSLNGLVDIKFENFNTSNVHSMFRMFYTMGSIGTLDLTCFDTAQVTDFRQMFYKCTKLTDLDVSSFRTVEATRMDGMFAGCSSLGQLDVSRFATPKVTCMDSMFSGLQYVEMLDLSSFVTLNVTDIDYMFYNMKSLVTVYANDGWTTKNVKNHYRVFYNDTFIVGGCGTTFDSKFINKTYARVDTEEIPGYFTFKALTLMPGPDFNVAVKNAISYADTDTRITKIIFGTMSDYRSLVTTAVNYAAVDNDRSGVMMAYRVVQSNGDIHLYVLSDVVISTNLNASYLFYEMRSLQSITFSNWETKYATNMSNMFGYDSQLTKLDMSKFTTDNVVNMAGMFYDCRGLTDLDLSKFNTETLWQTENMFRYCSNLETVLVGPFWNVENVRTSSNMFGGCNKIEGGYGTTFDPTIVNIERGIPDHPGKPGYLTYLTYTLKVGQSVAAAIKGGTYGDVNTTLKKVIFGYQRDYQTEVAKLKGTVVDINNKGDIMAYRSLDGTTAYVLSSCDIAANVNSSYMFYNCQALESVVFQNFNSRKTTNMNHMFYNCTALPAPELTGMSTDSVVDMSYMYTGCTSFKELDLSLFDSPKVQRFEYMFSGCTNLESVNLSGLDANSGVTFAYMFSGCKSLTEIDMRGMEVGKITSMGGMFQECSGLQKVTMSKLNLRSLASTAYMFRNCTALQNFDAYGSRMPVLQDLSYMFYQCSNIAKIDMSTLESTNVKNMAYTFYKCSKLQTIYVNSRWTNTGITGRNFTFYNDYSLMGGFGTRYTSMYTGGEYAVIDSYDTPGYLTSGSVRLLPGPELNDEIKKAANVGAVQTVVFGDAYKYTNDIAGITPVSVDEGRSGTIRMYATPTAIYIVSDYHIIADESAANMLSGLSAMTSVRFENLETDITTNYSGMFDGCSSLRNVDVSGFTTDGVTTYANMFRGCSSLEEVDVTTFETANATTLAGMFAGCSSLTELDLSKFNTIKVSDMSTMFNGCSSLKTIVAGGDWTTEPVKRSNDMFTGCTSVVGGNGTTFNPAYTDAVRAVFDRSSKPGYLTMVRYKLMPGRELNELVKGNDATYITADYNVKSFIFGYLDDYATQVSRLPYTAVDEARKGTIRMYRPSANEVLVLSACDILANDTMSYTFYQMRGLQSVQFKNFDTAETKAMASMFNGCYNIANLDMSYLDTSKVTDFSYMFYNMYLDGEGLTNLNLAEWDTTSGENFEYMFAGNKALRSLDTSSFKTPKAQNMGCMFMDVAAPVIDVTGFVTTDVETMYKMFAGCTSISTLDVSSFDTSNVTDMRNMFQDCRSLLSIDVSMFNTSKVRSMSGLFSGCSSATAINVLNIDTSGVNDLSNLFNGCSALEMIDLSTFNTSAVTIMSNMFYNCNRVKTIYAGRLWNVSKVLNSIDMFKDCTSVVGGDGTTFDPDIINVKRGIIDDLPDHPGYLTLKGYTLIPGPDLAIEIKDSSVVAQNTDIVKIVFGYKSDYPSAASKPGIAVDVEKLGYIKLHRVTSGTRTEIYILSDCEIRANEDSSYSFYNLKGLTEAIFENYNSSYSNNLAYMFNGCSSIRHLNLEGFETPAVTTMAGMFEGCTALIDLDMSGFTAGSLENTSKMFNGDGALTTVTAGGAWSLSPTATSTNMFTGCNVIKGSNGTTFDAAHIDGEYARIDFEDTPGYFSISYVTLLDGRDFNIAIKNINADRDYLFSSKNETIGNVVVGFLGNYESVVQNQPWVAVDNERSGKIKAYLVPDGTGSNTLYVVSNNGIQTSEDASVLFYRLAAMKTIALQNFRTSNATKMTSMFNNCESLTSFDISLLDMSNVQNASSMFANSPALTSVSFANNNAKSLTDISSMFESCESLQTADLSSVRLNNVTTLESLFSGCKSLKTVTFGSSPVTSNVETFANLFNECESLTTITGASAFNTAKATDMSFMYNGCSSLTSLSVNGYSTANVTMFDYMFGDCSNVATIDVSRFNTAKATSFEGMFSGCSKVTSLAITGFNTTQATSLAAMFNGCESLTTLNVANMRTANVEDMSYMFNGCAKVTSLNMSAFDTSKVTNMAGMFGEMAAITKLDLAAFNTSKVTDMGSMFINDPVLKTIEVSKDWSTARVSESTDMFLGDVAVVGGNGTTYNQYIVNARYAVIDSLVSPGYLTMVAYTLDIGKVVCAVIKGAGAGSTSGYNSNSGTISKIVFGKTADYSANVRGYSGVAVDSGRSGYIKCYRVGSTAYILSDYGIRGNADSSYMFNQLTGLKTMVCENLDMSYTTNMAYMFNGCTGASVIDIKELATYSATNMSNMFSNCTALKTIIVGDGWSASGAMDTDNGGTSANMFTGSTNIVGGHGTALKDMVTEYEAEGDKTTPYNATYAEADDVFGNSGMQGYLTGETVAAEFYNELPDDEGDPSEEGYEPPTAERLQLSVIPVGATPTFDYGTPKTPKASSVGYDRVFTGWSPTIAAQTGYVRYDAKYVSQKCPVYKVTFNLDGGTVDSMPQLYYWVNAGFVMTSNPTNANQVISAGTKVFTGNPKRVGYEYFGFGIDEENMYILVDGNLSRKAPALTADTTWNALWDQKALSGKVSLLLNGNPIGTEPPRYGDELKAVATDLPEGATAYYKWCRDGVPIEGVEGTEEDGANVYSPIADDVGHKLSCMVVDANEYYAGNIVSDETAEVHKGIWDKRVKAIITGGHVDEEGNTVFGVGDRVAVKFENAPVAGTTTMSDTQWHAYDSEDATTSTVTSRLPFFYLKTAQYDKYLGISLELENSCYEINGYKRGTDDTTLNHVESDLVHVGQGDLNVTVGLMSYAARMGTPISAMISGLQEGITDLTYQWCYLDEDNKPVAIDGATGSVAAAEGVKVTYTPTGEVVGYELVCQVRDGSTPQYYGGVCTSDKSDRVAKVLWPDLTSASVALTGDPKVGLTLTVTGPTPPEGITLTYEWHRDRHRVDAVIDGVTTADYVLTPAEYDNDVYVVVGIESAGYTAYPVTTNRLHVEKGDIAGTVTIDPTNVGFWQDITATVTDLPVGATPTYQWYRIKDGVETPINGATGQTYRTSFDDIGSSILCKVTDSPSGFYAGTIVSDPTDAVPEPTKSYDVSLSGSFTVGEDVTATVGNAAEGDLLTYIWEYSDDKEHGPWTEMPSLRTTDVTDKSQTVTLPPDCLEKYIRVTVVSLNAKGQATSESVISELSHIGIVIPMAMKMVILSDGSTLSDTGTITSYVGESVVLRDFTVKADEGLNTLFPDLEPTDASVWLQPANKAQRTNGIINGPAAQIDDPLHNGYAIAPNGTLKMTYGLQLPDDVNIDFNADSTMGFKLAKVRYTFTLLDDSEKIS